MDVLRLDHNIIAGEMFALKSSGGLSASTILRITLNYGIIVITDMSREREREDIERWQILSERISELCVKRESLY